MLKNLVFDMGNVIIDWNPKVISERINKNQSSVIMHYLFHSPTWIRLDQGLVSLDDGLREILNDTPKEYHQIIKFAYYHWFEYIDILDGTKSIIQKYKNMGYGIYMLSNCSKMFYSYFQTYDIFNLFDGFYVSADTQMLKPDVNIYQDFLHKFELDADECLFIDDISDNVQSAKIVGMHVFQFKKNFEELEEAIHQEAVIYIKPHHLVDIVKLYGSGIDYFIPDRSFDHDFYRVANVIVNDMNHLVRFTIQGDDICLPCKFYQNNHCVDYLSDISKEKLNICIDNNLIHLLNLSLDKEYLVKEILYKIKNNIDIIYQVWEHEESSKLDLRINSIKNGINKLL